VGQVGAISGGVAAAEWWPEGEALACSHLSCSHLASSATCPHMRGQVGAISGGVAAAEWSPEGEVLALVSGDAQLLLMSKVTNPNPTRPWSCAARACTPGVAPRSRALGRLLGLCRLRPRPAARRSRQPGRGGALERPVCLASVDTACMPAIVSP